MNIEQATKIEQRERQKIRRQSIMQEKAAVIKARKDRRWAMKELYPKDLAQIKKDIAERAKLCARNPHWDREVAFDMPGGLRHDAYLKRLKRDLKGFTFDEKWVPAGTADMGDFNAPCVIETGSYYRLIISWDK